MADQKPTQVASTVARMEANRLAQEKQADAKAAKGEIPPTLVLVRLSRPCFDSSGVLHGVEDPALLLPGDVPTTAKIIAVGEDVTEDDFSLGFKEARRAEENIAKAREEAQSKAMARNKTKVGKPEDDSE